ncbi:MAG: hypothetical protein O9325_08460 [Roseomonas sp.]|nr:hypothetical protein [Roseomonas sp.]
MSGGLPTSALARALVQGGSPKDLEGAIRLLGLAQMETSLAIMAIASVKQEDEAVRLADAFQRAIKAFETAEAAMKKLD